MYPQPTAAPKIIVPNMLPGATRVPGVPTVPGIPGVPTVPGIPGLPRVPTVQQIPIVPRVPTVPGVPQVPTIPRVPIVPQVPIIRPPTVPIVPQVPIVQPPTVPIVPQVPIVRPPTVPMPNAIPSPSPVPMPNMIPVQSPQPIEQVHTPEQFIEMIIREQDADTAQEKEYLGYVRYLLNDESKYDIFSRLFPENTCRGVHFRLESPSIPEPNVEPSDDALVECVRAKEAAGKSVAVSFSYENHANMIWFDTINKEINRYDPQVPFDDPDQRKIDNTIRQYLEIWFPEYRYLGNSIELFQCVQGVRGEGRQYKSDYFCQDYSLLYAINRINGMSHEEAAWALVARGDKVLDDLAELLRGLAYRVRSEIGKPIPERYREWKPVIQTEW
jgi:hypothetical protein